MDLNEKKAAAIWAAKSLFERGKTSGSSANISFLHEGAIYISASGTCFGTLGPDDFASASMAQQRAAAPPDFIHKKSENTGGYPHAQPVFHSVELYGIRSESSGRLYSASDTLSENEAGQCGACPL